MNHLIDYSPDVRTNVSERRAEFYRALPDRTDVGLVDYPIYSAPRKRVSIPFVLVWAVIAIIALAVS